jgi:hypothetical protein
MVEWKLREVMTEGVVLGKVVERVEESREVVERVLRVAE